MTDMRNNNNAVRVDNHGIQWRGVFYYTLTQNQWRKKKYDEEGKEMEKERIRRKKKCSWLDSNSAPLCCEYSV